MTSGINERDHQLEELKCRIFELNSQLKEARKIIAAEKNAKDKLALSQDLKWKKAEHQEQELKFMRKRLKALNLDHQKANLHNGRMKHLLRVSQKETAAEMDKVKQLREVNLEKVAKIKILEEELRLIKIKTKRPSTAPTFEDGAQSEEYLAVYAKSGVIRERMVEDLKESKMEAAIAKKVLFELWEEFIHDDDTKKILERHKEEKRPSSFSMICDCMKNSIQGLIKGQLTALESGSKTQSYIKTEMERLQKAIISCKNENGILSAQVKDPNILALQDDNCKLANEFLWQYWKELEENILKIKEEFYALPNDWDSLKSQIETDALEITKILDQHVDDCQSVNVGTLIETLDERRKEITKKKDLLLESLKKYEDDSTNCLQYISAGGTVEAKEFDIKKSKFSFQIRNLKVRFDFQKELKRNVENVKRSLERHKGVLFMGEKFYNKEDGNLAKCCIELNMEHADLMAKKKIEAGLKEADKKIKAVETDWLSKSMFMQIRYKKCSRELEEIRPLYKKLKEEHCEAQEKLLKLRQVIHNQKGQLQWALIEFNDLEQELEILKPTLVVPSKDKKKGAALISENSKRLERQNIIYSRRIKRLQEKLRTKWDDCDRFIAQNQLMKMKLDKLSPKSASKIMCKQAQREPETGTLEKKSTWTNGNEQTTYDLDSRLALSSYRQDAAKPSISEAPKSLTSSGRCAINIESENASFTTWDETLENTSLASASKTTESRRETITPKPDSRKDINQIYALNLPIGGSIAMLDIRKRNMEKEIKILREGNRKIKSISRAQCQNILTTTQEQKDAIAKKVQVKTLALSALNSKITSSTKRAKIDISKLIEEKREQNKRVNEAIQILIRAVSDEQQSTKHKKLLQRRTQLNQRIKRRMDEVATQAKPSNKDVTTRTELANTMESLFDELKALDLNAEEALCTTKLEEDRALQRQQEKFQQLQRKIQSIKDEKKAILKSGTGIMFKSKSWRPLDSSTFLPPAERYVECKKSSTWKSSRSRKKSQINSRRRPTSANIRRTKSVIKRGNFRRPTSATMRRSHSITNTRSDDFFCDLSVK